MQPTPFFSQLHASSCCTTARPQTSSYAESSHYFKLQTSCIRSESPRRHRSYVLPVFHPTILAGTSVHFLPDTLLIRCACYFPGSLNKWLPGRGVSCSKPMFAFWSSFLLQCCSPWYCESAPPTAVKAPHVHSMYPLLHALLLPAEWADQQNPSKTSCLLSEGSSVIISWSVISSFVFSPTRGWR